jgi:hypothetical protein
VALPLSDFLLVEISAMSYNLDGVKAIYEAFGKGDISGILERLSEAGRWEQWTDNEARKAGVPWLQSRIGKEGVAEFFTIVVFEQPDSSYPNKDPSSVVFEGSESSGLAVISQQSVRIQETSFSL